jgi:hypothetical protein
MVEVLDGVVVSYQMPGRRVNTPSAGARYFQCRLGCGFRGETIVVLPTTSNLELRVGLSPIESCLLRGPTKLSKHIFSPLQYLTLVPGGCQNVYVAENDKKFTSRPCTYTAGRHKLGKTT